MHRRLLTGALLFAVACRFSIDRQLVPGELRASFAVTAAKGTTETSAPAAAASVTLPGTPFAGLTDARGRIDFRGLPGGSYTMVVLLEANEVPQALLDLRNIDIAAGQGRDLGTLVLTAAGAVSGTVLLNGEPVADAALQVLDASGAPLPGLPTIRSDAGGQYAIPYLPAGEERVSALFTPGAGGPAETALSAPFQVVPRERSTVDIDLLAPTPAPDAELRARVSAAASPPSSADITLVRDDGSKLTFRTQPSAPLDITPIPAGIYLLEVGASGFRTQVLRDEVLTGLVDLGTIVLSPPGAPACATNNGGCDSNATCTDTPTGPVCACEIGYAGTGLACQAVNLCDQTPPPCDAHATCTSTPGGFTCTCNVGYFGPGTTCSAIAISSIAISPPSASVEIGHSTQLSAMATWNDGTMRDITAQASWSSDAPLVASVSGGLVTGLATGGAHVSAALEAGTDSISVSVTPLLLTGISIAPAGPVGVGASVQLDAAGQYDDGSTADVTAQVSWQSSDPTTASITPSGLLTGVMPGAVTITASQGLISGTQMVSVASLPVYQVTPSGDGNEMFLPSGTQSITGGTAATVLVTPNAGYAVSQAVGGTCPAGSWSTNVYTTGLIVADCSIVFAASSITVQVTATGDGNETIVPATGPFVVGGTASFTVDPNPGYSVSSVVGGSCPTGTWSSDVYTTDVLTTDCDVTFTATLDSYQVTATGDGNEMILPAGPQVIGYGLTAAWTVDPLTGFNVDVAVGGTCLAGSWSADVYTTGSVLADCTVSFTATMQGIMVPGAPTNVVAAAGTGSATISWDTPVDDGGSPVTGYTITATPGGAQVSAVTAAPTVFPGLMNGTAYTFTVHATNIAGDGPESIASNPVTPTSVPDAPTSVSAIAGDASATVSWTSPASDGGSPITGYTVTATPGGAQVQTSGATSTLFPGLTNGTSYTFTVHATNADGDGPESAPSSPVTPSTVPDAPTGVSASAGAGSATISWMAPASDGGSPITGYTVTATPGGAQVQTSGATTTLFPGLTDGMPYTFTVHATNANGDGPESVASIAVTPAATPGAPTGVTAVAGTSAPRCRGRRRSTMAEVPSPATR
jgi:hypothetical protein